jgi:hypothetical protein
MSNPSNSPDCVFAAALRGALKSRISSVCYLVWSVCAIRRTVDRGVRTAEIQFQLWGVTCGICGGRSGIRASFASSALVFSFQLSFMPSPHLPVVRVWNNRPVRDRSTKGPSRTPLLPSSSASFSNSALPIPTPPPQQKASTSQTQNQHQWSLCPAVVSCVLPGAFLYEDRHTCGIHCTRLPAQQAHL